MQNVALIHDWLTNYGGSERCLTEFIKIFPATPIYTTVWNQKQVPQFQTEQVFPSWLQNVPGSKHFHPFFFPWMPRIFEDLDLQQYDLILSSSHSCAKGIIPRPDALHICYCYTPTRYLWDLAPQYLENSQSYFPGWRHLRKALISRRMHHLRQWDRLAAERVDAFIACSHFIKQRIEKYYRRSSTVIYPPVNIASFHRAKENDKEDYFLIISRFVPYKRIDLAIQACQQLNLPLKIVGSGPQYHELRRLVRSTDQIEFVGNVDEAEKRELLAKSRGYLFPALEDFGITAVEAQASGVPVIALGRGGSAETVEHNVTGIHFPEQTLESITQALQSFHAKNFDPQVLREKVQRFDTSHFHRRIRQFVEQQWQAFQRKEINQRRQIA